MRPCRRQHHACPIPGSYSQAAQIFPTELKSAESSRADNSPWPTALCSPAPNVCPWQSPDKQSCGWNSAEEHPLSKQHHLPLLSAMWPQTTSHPSQRQSMLLLIYFALSLSTPWQEKGHILFRRHLGFCPMRHEGCCNLWKFSNRAYPRVPWREMLNETALQEVKIPYNAFLINLSGFTALIVAVDKICLIKLQGGAALWLLLSLDRPSSASLDFLLPSLCFWCFLHVATSLLISFFSQSLRNTLRFLPGFQTKLLPIFNTCQCLFG